MYLNERSFESPVDSQEAASRFFGELFSLLRTLDRRLQGISVVGHQRLTDITIGFYSASVWLGADVDRIRRIRTIMNRAPFDSDFESVRKTLQGELEFRRGPETVIGLGLASWHDCLAVSVNREPWQHSLLTLHRILLAEAHNGQLIEQEHDVPCRHATAEHHLEDHADWIDTNRVDAPRTPDELWHRRTHWFPDIAFVPPVRAQVRELGAANPAFCQIVEKLTALQHSVSTWNGVGAPDWGIFVTGENEGRKGLCWFKDLDGHERLFDQHARFTPGEGRIHFRLDGANRRIVVAYVGRKLGI